MKRTIYLLLLLLIFITGCAPGRLVIAPTALNRKLNESRIQRDPHFFVFDKIAVIEVDGILVNKARPRLFSSGENPVSLFLEKLNRAQKDPFVKALVLRINSPGGTVAASDMMHHALGRFKAATGKPVVACMLDVAASGGYYIACRTDGIVAQPATVTGSIGTVFQSISFAGTMKKIGIKSESVKSGPFKDIGSPFHDMQPDERRIIEGIIMHFHEKFIEVILAGREQLKPEKLKTLADGRVFTAEQALEHGLIDRIGYPSDAVAWAKELAGIDKANVVIYHRPLGYKPNIYASAAETSTAALINVQLPDWLGSDGPQFLYLWQITDFPDD